MAPHIPKAADEQTTFQEPLPWRSVGVLRMANMQDYVLAADVVGFDLRLPQAEACSLRKNMIDWLHWLTEWAFQGHTESGYLAR